MFENWRTRRVLKKAKRLLIKNGWVRGYLSTSLISPRAAHCAVGAIQAVSNYVETNRATLALFHAIYPDYPLTYNTNVRTKVMAYNDYLAEDKDSVLAMFGKAIESLK